MSPAPHSARGQIVEASAGTGKTRTLVSRIVEAVEQGIPIEEVVAVTFTHAAAGEMKLRLRQELDGKREHAAPDVRACYDTALQKLERAFIGTIHAFCAQMLRQRPVEAEVDPAFVEFAEPEARALFHSVFQGWLTETLAAEDATLRRVLRRILWREETKGEDPADELERAAWTLTEWRDFDTPWARSVVNREEGIREILPAIDHVLELRSRCKQKDRDWLYRDLQPLADYRERTTRSECIGAWDLDSAEGDLLDLPRELQRVSQGWGPFGDGVTREEVVASTEALLERIRLYGERADADLAAALRDLLWPVVLRYEAAKRSAGALDFQDLLIRGARLLQNDHARHYFQNRYRRLFVDEFQDTDPLQAEILLLLSSADPQQRDWREVSPVSDKLFLVGDPKQSIYRFRRADVSTYRNICDTLGGRGVPREALQQSHRSTRALQAFVNSAFEERMQGYLPLTEGREEIANQPSVLALPMPFPYGRKRLAKSAINACAPSTVAAFVSWLVNDSGWSISDPRDTARLVPVRPEHVCILFRRFTNFGTDLTQEYVRALEARGIPHVLVGSKSFHGREEVGAIRAALRAVEWPDDELNLFATLRGPLFSISDSTLFKFRVEHCAKRALHPYMSLPDDLDPEFERLRDALAFLAEMHRIRNYHPAADIINRLLENARAHAGFAFRKGGERVLANVYRVMDVARGFEARGGLSFRGFVEYLEGEADSGEASEAPLLEQDGGGVKLMTVHKAKGLEFPVVILADLTANLTGFDGCSRYVDASRRLCAQRIAGFAPLELLQPEIREQEQRAEMEEAERVAYVAATRARDLLVVSAVGDEEFKGWLSPLHESLYPRESEWRQPNSAPGCPAFGFQSVLRRPPDSQAVDVRPGLHRSRRGGNHVVWFDPGLLDLNDARAAGLEHEEVLKGSAEPGLTQYRTWRAHRDSVIQEASKRAMTPQRVTESTSMSAAEDVNIEYISVAKEPHRPTGRRFGKLVHALLEKTPIPPTLAGLRLLAASESKRLGATVDEIDAAVAASWRTLSLPMLQETGSASRIYREYPVLLRDGDTLLEGTIDLAYERNGVWTLIDFKTGPADGRRNERQLKIYALAMARATGASVKAFLIGV